MRMWMDKELQAALDAEEEAKQPEFTDEDVRQLMIYWSTLAVGKHITGDQLWDLIHNIQDTNPKLWEAIQAMIAALPDTSSPWSKHVKFNNKYGPKLTLDIKPTSQYHTRMIIGITGLIGSGKDTAADYLCTVHGFKRMSFAGTLKDAVAAVFGWDRELLEGSTKASREWREQVDEWWANRLGIPDLTPRYILQQ